MRQGEIWKASLGPIKGSEQDGFRPVVIISGNPLNEHLPIVIVCPLTSKIKGYKGNVILSPLKDNGLKVKSEILNFHIKSISKDRLIKRLGRISASQVEEIKLSLNDILNF